MDTNTVMNIFPNDFTKRGERLDERRRCCTPHVDVPGTKCSQTGVRRGVRKGVRKGIRQGVGHGVRQGVRQVVRKYMPK